MLRTIITVIQLIFSVALTLIVLLQSGKTAGLSGAIAGGAETFLSKNKAKSMDARLARATKYVAIIFILLTLALNMVYA